MRKNIIFNVKNVQLLLLLLILAVSTGAATSIQFIKGNMVQFAISQHANQLIQQIMLFFGAMCLEVLFYYVEWRFENRVIAQSFYSLKKGIINNVMKFENLPSAISKKDATQILTNSISSLEFPYYGAWFNNLYLILRVVFVFTSIMLINVWLALILLVLMIIPLGVTQLFKAKVSLLNKKYMDQMGKNLNHYENLIGNLNSIHIFKVRQYFFKKIDAELAKERNFKKDSKTYQYGLNVSYSFISYLSNFVVLTFSMILISKGSLTIGTAITLLGLVDQLSMPILALSRNTSAINSTQSVRNDIENAFAENATSKPVVPFTQVLTVNDLHIELAEKELTYQNVTITKGQSYIIRGASGIGKTVFLKTMLALAPFDTGTIMYDAKNIGQQAQADVFADLRYI